MFVLREMCTFIQGIGADNIGKTSLFTFSLYGIYMGWARYNAAYYMVINNSEIVILQLNYKGKSEKGNVCPQRNVHFHPRYWHWQYWEDKSVYAQPLWNL